MNLILIVNQPDDHKIMIGRINTYMYPPKREEGLLILHFKNFLFICGLTLIRNYKLILTVIEVQFYAADMKYLHTTFKETDLLNLMLTPASE